jgi:hypothetical protein
MFSSVINLVICAVSFRTPFLEMVVTGVQVMPNLSDTATPMVFVPTSNAMVRAMFSPFLN